MSRSSIRRPSRLGAIVLFYRTRWLFFLTILILFGMTSPALFKGWQAIDYVTSAAPAIPHVTPQAHVFVRDHGAQTQGAPSNWNTLRGLTLGSGLASCKELWDPNAMPKLESLTVYDAISDHQLIKICELYDLKSLSLFQSSDLTDVAMKRLAEEPQLEHLRMSNIYMHESPPLPGELPAIINQRKEHRARTLHYAQEVSWPASLKTLEFDDGMGTPDSRLREFQKLPHLHTLITRLYPRDQSLRLSSETIELLNGIPSLRRLFLMQAGKHSPNHIEIQQAALPRLIVRPSTFNRTLGNRTSVVVVIGLVCAMLIATQLSTQFVTPSSQLVPGFTIPHMMSSLVALFISIICCGITLFSVGCQIPESVALSGFPIFVIISLSRLMRRLSTFPLPGFTNIGMNMPYLVFPCIGIQVVAWFFASELNWYLRGQYPLLSCFLIAGSIWAIVDLVRMHLELARVLEEGGVANVPLDLFDLKGWTAWNREIMTLREKQGKKSPMVMRGRDAVLDRFEESLNHNGSMTTHQLWNLGNPASLIWPSVLMGSLSLIGGLGWAWLMEGATNRTASGAPAAVVLLPSVAQLFVMSLSMAFAMVWQRRPMFAFEILRPMTRDDWRSLWFRGISFELARIIPIAFAVSGLLWSLNAFEGWSTSQMTLGVFLAIGVSLLLIAIGLWLLTIDSWFWTLIGSLAVITVVMAAIFASVALGEYLKISDSPYNPILGLLLIYIAAIAMFLFAWRRWDRFEVGRIAN